MRSHLFLSALIVTTLCLGSNLTAGPASNQERVKINADYALSGPYTCQNLSIFLVHGKDRIKGKRLISLSDALERKLVTVDETGAVNRLTAQNKSSDVYVFIQSGDIVKGGQQDRTLSQDVILPPRSEKIALDAFCVEQGRWNKRGSESITEFSSAAKRLSSKQLKLAAKKSKSQQEVWQAVAAEQVRLSRNVGKSVQSDASATSLQLSLEDEAVEKKSEIYKETLLPVGRKATDAVGFAFAINGQFNSADIYGNSDLFQQLWPKLMASAANEAISVFDKEKVMSPIAAARIKEQILKALKTHKTMDVSSKGTKRMTGETEANHAFETRDEKDQMIHLNIIQKGL